MRLLLIFISVFVFAANLGAQCPGNGYSSTTELVDNGDFSNGNNDFSSKYTYCSTSGCLGFTQAYYTVGKEASNYSQWLKGNDHTTGSGEFFIANADGTANTQVWCQTIRVKPRTNYVVSAWFSKLYIYATWGTVSLQFSINGSKAGSAFNTPSDTGKWEQHDVIWYSGNNSTATVCVLNMTNSGFFSGSFGIDDISMRECICNYPASSSKDTAICAGDSAVIRASYGNNYIWAPTSSISCSSCQEVIARPAVTTNYFVAVTDTSTCVSSAVTKVTVIPIPVANITGDSVICNGAPVALKATLANADYLWNTGGTDSFITVTKPGNYWVQVRVNGCTDLDSFTVTETDLRYSLGNDTALCEGEVLTLSIPKNADTIIWQDGSFNKTFTVTTAGKYWATLMTGNCSYTDTIEVTYKPNPIINLGADTTLCEGEKLELQAGNIGATYLWQDGQKTQTITISTAGKYWVQVTQNACISSDTIEVKYQQPITVNLGKDTSLCEGGVVKLSAKNANWQNPLYVWQDGAVTEDYIVTEPGKYWVFVREGACTASDTIEVKYRPNPVPSLGKDISVCADEPVILDAGILANKYIWNTGDTTQTILAQKAGKYYVEATINGCVASDTVDVNFFSLPVFDLGKDTTLCEGQTLLLKADLPGLKYEWQDGFISPYHTVTKAGTYWARVDNGTCDYTDTIHVKYNAYPKIELGEDTLLCPGEKLILDVYVEGATYFWNDSTISNIKEISGPGRYWVELSQGPCKYSDTITVYYNDSPQVNLGKDSTFCGLENWRLEAGGNNNPLATYEWNTGQKSPNIVVTEPGAYWVKVSYCGVSVSDTISLGFINYKPEDLLMPNAFTPNDDKINDTLRAVGIDLVDAFEWRIYNRWGQLIYKSNDITKSWDGTYNGTPSPEGLYHWKLSLRSSCLKEDEFTRSGIVYLIR